MTGFWQFLEANRHALFQRALEHLDLTTTALLAAVLFGVPAGVAAVRSPRLSTGLLAVANLVQTIPSVALLGFLLPMTGIGRSTALVALVLYALLPILRNTIVGLQGVDAGVRDAARGMGMTRAQQLFGVELPLALPVILAGVRTAAVINVGVTTLAALIGAGGLGTFIFRGLATNRTAVILLGAIPAAILALGADGALAACERALRGRSRAWRTGLLGGLAALMAIWAWSHLRPAAPERLRFGFTAEFMERGDGYDAWRAAYGLPELQARELDPALLYSALRHEEVDVACGFSTDGRIEALDLRALEDDRRFFPEYRAALVVREAALEAHPGLGPLLEALAGSLTPETIRTLNRQVDVEKRSPAEVASGHLARWAKTQGAAWDTDRATAPVSGKADLVVGTKNFTEQYLLGQLICQWINGSSRYTAQIKAGLGGTSICFEAVRRGEIDLYPEYSGTLLASVVAAPPEGEEADAYLRRELHRRYGLQWMVPLGFDNTYAILVRKEDARFEAIGTLSELAAFASGQGGASPRH